MAKRRSSSVSSSITLLLFAFVTGSAASQGIPHVARTGQGGVLEMVVAESVHTGAGALEGSLVLNGYTGEPLRALQASIVVTGDFPVSTIDRGAALVDETKWLFTYRIKPAAAMKDTVVIVLLSMVAGGIVPAPAQELVKFSCIPPRDGASRKVELRLVEVLGALATGDNAGVLPGPPKTIRVIGATGVDDRRRASPSGFDLRQNYPNPFNPSTTIGFTLAHTSQVRLDVFTIAGQAVRTLRTGSMGAGSWSVRFDGHDDGGRALPSGVYVCRLRAGNFVASRKMILEK